MDDDSAPDVPDVSGTPDTARRDLEQLAAANRDAMFGDRVSSHAGVTGLVTGDLGPKGDAATRLRRLSRRERAQRASVPRGSSIPGGSYVLLLPMLLIGATLIGAVVLIGWWLS